MSRPLGVQVVWALLASMLAAGDAPPFTAQASIRLGNEDVPRDRFVVYLMLGHSNMAGYKTALPDQPVVPRTWMWDGAAHRWLAAQAPVPGTKAEHDKKNVASPILPFLHELARRHNGLHFGVVVHAEPLARFSFMRAVQRAADEIKLHATLGGIVLMHGEAESREPEAARSYAADLRAFVGELRFALDRPRLPLLVNLMNHNSQAGLAEVTAAINAAERTVPDTHLITGREPGLLHVHYDWPTYQLWAKRAADLIDQRKLLDPAAIASANQPERPLAAAPASRGRALVVSNNVGLDTAERGVVDLLRAGGFAIAGCRGDELGADRLRGAGLVVLANGMTSDAVLPSGSDAPLAAVISMHPRFHGAPLRRTTWTANHEGPPTVGRQQTDQLEIIAAGHPLAAGLSGTVRIAAAPMTVGWLSAAACDARNLVPVACLPGQRDRLVICAVEAFPDRQLRRVYIGDRGGLATAAASEQARALVRAAALWAAEGYDVAADAKAAVGGRAEALLDLIAGRTADADRARALADLLPALTATATGADKPARLPALRLLRRLGGEAATQVGALLALRPEPAWSQCEDEWFHAWVRTIAAIDQATALRVLAPLLLEVARRGPFAGGAQAIDLLLGLGPQPALEAQLAALAADATRHGYVRARAAAGAARLRAESTPTVLFRWDDGSRAMELPPQAGARARVCTVVARGIAMLDGDWRLDCEAGRFEADAASTRAIAEAVGRSGEFAVELHATPAAATGGGALLVLGGSVAGSQLAVVQSGNRFAVSLPGAPRRLIPLANAAPGRTCHLLVAIARDGQLRLYADGVRQAQGSSETGLAAWTAQPLTFGGSVEGDAWRGRLGGIVVRSVAPDDHAAATLARAASQRAASFAMPATATVKARLVQRSDLGKEQDPSVYRTMLIECAYDVVAVVRGSCPDRRIIVQHWATLDGALVPETAALRAGQELELEIVPIASQPQLKQERRTMLDDSESPVFYCRPRAGR